MAPSPAHQVAAGLCAPRFEVRWAPPPSFRVCPRECDTNAPAVFSSGKLVYERIFSMCVDHRSALPGNVTVPGVSSCPSQGELHAEPAFTETPYSVRVCVFNFWCVKHKRNTFIAL